MRPNIRTLQKIVSRRGSSKILSFGEPHVLKGLQILSKEGYVSRKSFCKYLKIGEGAVKTLILHLKQVGLADSVRAGTFLTKKGSRFVNEFNEIITMECSVGASEFTKSKNNYAVLLHNFRARIRYGIEQRDAAIVYGATGAITMIFHKNKFVFPGEESDCLKSDLRTRRILFDRLRPNESDVIILVSANNPLTAEIAAKNSALFTISL